jgi:hypothetical protein
MAIIVIKESGDRPRLFEVRRPQLTIGRAAECDLVLANVSVSRRHIDVSVLEDGSALLTVLARDNPVLHNDTPVGAHCRLAGGDHLRLGKYGLTYWNDKKLDLVQLQELSDLPHHVGPMLGSRPDATRALSVPLQRKIARLDVLRARAALFPLAGSGPAVRLGDQPVTLGPKAVLAVPGKLGSSSVAEVSWDGSGHTIRSQGWFTSMRINGSSVKSEDLDPGDVVEVNGVSFRYDLVAA